MSGVTHHDVLGNEAGLRLDRWFRERFPDLKHGRLEKLLRTGQIRLDGARVKANARLEAGQVIRIPPMEAPPPVHGRAPRALSAEDRAFVRSLVLYEDDDVLVLNKPPGLAAQGGSKTARHLDGLLSGLKRKGERPRLVHRLDRDTSGVIVLARTRSAASALGKAFKAKDAHKVYWALTAGVPRPERGRIEAPLAKRSGKGREQVHLSEPGEEGAQKAQTDFALIAQAGTRLAWVAFAPLTGRTHQIRVHAAEVLKTPIVGDGKYGGARAHPGGEIAKRLHLHARAIDIAHPAGGRLRATAPLPEHMAQAWRLLGFDEADCPADPFEESPA